MSHPILTFRHLLPGNAELRAIGGPEWFGALFARDASGGPSTVPVAWGASLPAIAPRIADAPAFAGVNCHGCSEARLRAAGFAHVRRFALLPSARDARWFIPLDSTQAADAALSLYRPVRLPARAVHGAARAVARVGLPLWYRDELCIARRTLSPLEHLLEDLFPGRAVRVALSGGAPIRAPQRKVSMAAISTSGEILGFAKSGATGVARQLVRHEAEVLATLATRDAMNGRAPRVLFAGEVGDSFVHVQTLLPGETARATLTQAHRALLAALRGSAVRPAAASGFVRTLRARVAALQSSRPLFGRLFDTILPRLERTIVARTIVHGDFAPWNIRLHDGVASAIDWEYAEIDGLPLIDECNHLLLVGCLMQEWRVDVALGRLRAMARSAPLGMSPTQVETLQLAHLLDVTTRLAVEHSDVEPIAEWFTEVLLRLVEQQRARAAWPPIGVSSQRALQSEAIR